MSLTGKPAETEDGVIANDGFFPDFVLSEFLRPYRIPTEYDNEALINAIVLGIVEINKKLAPVKAAKTAEGFSTLDDYLDAQDEARVNGQFELVIIYQKAVFSWAKAMLLQQFNGMNRRNPATENDTAAAMNTTDYWLDQSTSARYQFLAAFGLESSENAVRDAHQPYVALL